MATFTSFANILPDPANPITDAGDTSSSGTPGPGFSAIGFSSVTDTQVSRTVSGRGVQRDGGSQHWEFTISYNPMFRFQFDPIDTFLLGRNPRRDPFYVILPQHAKPKDPAFATSAANNVYAVRNSASQEAGTNVLTIYTNGNVSGTPKPGDVFNLNDSGDYNHQKAYKITAVETTNYYQAGTPQPGSNEFRIHISPPLQRTLQAEPTLVTFINPKFRVIAKADVQEYQLNTDNLYSFSLSLEEIQP